MRQQSTLKKPVGILWLLAFVGLLALIWLALPTWEAQAGITPTPTSAPATNTPQPPPTNTPKPHNDDKDDPPPPPTATPVLTATPTPTPTAVIPSMLPQTGGSIPLPWIALVIFGGLVLLTGLLINRGRIKS